MADETIDPWDPSEHKHESTVPIDLAGAALHVTCGRMSGTTWRLGDTAVILGRASEADLVFDDISVSRRHAEITSTPLGYVVRDLGSTNGTYVNGVRVEVTELRGGDELRVGRFCVSFVGA